MIQNLDAHLNKLQAQCDYLRHKLSTFPEGELSIQKNGSYHRWIIKNKVSDNPNVPFMYIAQSQIVLSRKLWL